MAVDGHSAGVMWNTTLPLTTTDIIINTTDNKTVVGPTRRELNWGVLALTLLIVATAIGNVLVCLAVCWEKRLQNMTNYFLMSLAIADLLVALLVMPFGMIVELYGYFPLDPGFCVMWATMDVLMCTASIWHMCTMSMDRYFTLKYPMKYGRNKTKTMVALKIMFVWVVSIAISSPVCILGFLDYSHVFNNNICVPTIRDFIIYGSLFAFYIPFTIMVLTYVLTIKILCNNQKLMRSIVRDHSVRARCRKEKNGTYSTTYLTPNMYNPRFLDRPSAASIETSLSVNASINETSIGPSNLSSPKDERIIPIVAEPSEHNDSIADTINSEQNDMYLSFQMQPNLSVSQPHLPSMLSPPCSPYLAHHSLLLPRASSHHSVQHSRRPHITENFCGMISAATSINSTLSMAHYGSDVFSEFDEDMLDKLSQIEQEMDECLYENPKRESNYTVNGENGEDNDDDDDNDDEGIEQSGSEEDKLVDIPAPSSSSLCHVPPVTVCTPPETASDDTLDDSDSENSGLITIRLNPSGCYLYKVAKGGLTPSDINHADSMTFQSLTPSPRCNSLNNSLEENEEAVTLSTNTAQTYSQKVQYKCNSRVPNYGTGWKAFLHRKKKKEKKEKKKKSKSNGVIKTVIPKRTASNEKKASKVLGIIFAVFVLLWTPFFIVNILAVVCWPCIEAMTPAVMVAIVWLGYMSSLANPIIYTMFNTAFRRAFYKILTCNFPRQQTVSTPDTLLMTNPSHWGSDRRNTLTLTLKEY